MNSKANKVTNCSILNLSKFINQKGNITVLENLKSIPFKVKRIYYLYDIPTGESRGFHAHYDLEQYIIAVSGSFEIILEDGKNDIKFFLNNPNKALHIVPGIWREIVNFSSNAVCLVLASAEYDETDYIRDKNIYIKYKNEK